MKNLLFVLLVMQSIVTASADAYDFKIEGDDSNWKTVFKSDDSLYFVGERYLDDSGKENASRKTIEISKTNFKGDIVWRDILKSRKNLYFLSVSYSNNEDICVLAAEENSGDETFYLSLYYINKNGEILWRRLLENEYNSKDIRSSLNFKKYHVMAINDFGCIVAGSRYFSTGESEIIAFDTKGDSLYKNNLSNETPIRIADVISSKGVWLIAMRKPDKVGQSSALYIDVMRFASATGKILSTFELGPFYYGSIYSGLPVPGKGIILAGEIESKPWVLMVNEKGEVDWQKISEMRPASYHSLKATSDGSILLLGVSNDFPGRSSLSGSFVHKVSLDGALSEYFHSKIEKFQLLDFFEVNGRKYFLGETWGKKTGLMGKVKSACELEKTYCD